MRDDLFSVPIRKYHIDNNQEFVDYFSDVHKRDAFSLPSPYIQGIELPDWTVPFYSGLLEQFLHDLKAYDTHYASIRGVVLKVLDQGEGSERIDTLPSHYTLTHYIKIPAGQSSDIFHHPARILVNAFDPKIEGLNEYKDAAGLYITSGDVIIYPSFLETGSPVNEHPDKRMTLTLIVTLDRNEQGRELSTEEPTS